MPFAPCAQPSLQLGILKAILNDLSIQSRSFFLSTKFWEKSGLDSIDPDGGMGVLAEWTFARKLCGKRSTDDEIQRFVHHDKNLLHLRNCAEEFIDEIIEDDQWNDYDAVAFTCTYYQLTPSLALAKSLKEKHPHLLTMFGGKVFFESSAVEFITKLPFMDFVFIGDSETTFRNTMIVLSNGKNLPSSTEGIVFRCDDKIIFNGYAPPDNVELSVLPDYSDFFEQMPQYKDTALISYEAGRGCWYGEKNHCTFCSLNTLNMIFRPKPLAKVEAEITKLHELWNPFRIVITDNILSPEFIHHVVPRLKHLKTNFWCQAKPDLKPYEIRQLTEAGFDRIVLGIENFDPEALKLMNKGQSVLNSISLLKWAKFYSLHPLYNILFRIPHDTEAMYDNQLMILHKIAHLSSAAQAIPISVERFGVYYQNNTVSGIRPAWFYHYYFPDTIDIEKIAYHFSYNANILDEKEQRICQFVNKQSTQHRFLKFDGKKVKDRRWKKEINTHLLSNDQYACLKFATLPVSMRTIQDKFDDSVIQSLEELELVLCMEGKMLSLVEIEKTDEYLSDPPSNMSMPVVTTTPNEYYNAHEASRNHPERHHVSHDLVPLSDGIVADDCSCVETMQEGLLQ